MILEMLARNADLLEKFSLTDLLAFKNAASKADDIVRLLSEHGRGFVNVYRAYGDDVVAVALKLGDGALDDLQKYGLELIGLVRTKGDDFAGLYQKYGSEFVAKCLRYGDDVFVNAAKYGDDYIELLMRYGDDVMEGLRLHGDDFMEQYRKRGDEFIDDFLKRGDEALKGGSITIIKETDSFIDYLNPAGQKIRIPKQSSKSIDSAIATKFNSTNKGVQIEAKVANFVKNELGIELTDFGNKVKDSTGQVIGDIDCATRDVLIEVKNSISSASEDQIEKYVDVSNKQYINIANKKVILYIEETIENLSQVNQEKLENIRQMGVTVVNGLEELKGVLE